MTAFLVYLLALVLISLVAFWQYASDKMRAKNDLWRIPEGALLALGFFGGAIGALIGMNWLRHKTKHWYFWVVNVLGLVWQLVMAAYLFAVGI